MSKFKVGDRVVAINPVAGLRSLINKHGIVVVVDHSGYDVGVEFDEAFESGHSASGFGKSGYCRFGWDSEFEIVTFVPENIISFEDMVKGCE